MEYVELKYVSLEQTIEELKIILEEKDLYNFIINEHINCMINNCNSLTTKTNIDKTVQKIVVFLNNLRLKYEPAKYKPIYEEFSDFYNDALKKIVFQKDVLVELKKNLLKTKKTENYDQLLLQTELLYTIFSYDNRRREENHINFTTIKCDFSSINYIPAPAEKMCSDYEQNIKRLYKDINNK